jgi:hypothetical protein
MIGVLRLVRLDNGKGCRELTLLTCLMDGGEQASV